MKVLLLGVSGQVGQAVLANMPECYKVLSPSRIELPLAGAASAGNLARFINLNWPDVIINCAAYTSVDQAEQEADVCFAINADALAELGQAASKVGAAIIHLSTDYVFDGQKTSPYVEFDAAHPLSVYGKSKRVGEISLLSLCPRALILRTSWVFSASHPNFVRTMLRLANDGGDVSVVNDQIGGPTSATGIARVIVELLRKLQLATSQHHPFPFGIYHYCGAPYVSWYEFACHIFERAQALGVIAAVPKVIPVSTQQYIKLKYKAHSGFNGGINPGLVAQRPLNSRLDCALIQDRFAIAPDDWQTELERVLGYF